MGSLRLKLEVVTSAKDTSKMPKVVEIRSTKGYTVEIQSLQGEKLNMGQIITNHCSLERDKNGVSMTCIDNCIMERDKNSVVMTCIDKLCTGKATLECDSGSVTIRRESGTWTRLLSKVTILCR